MIYKDSKFEVDDNQIKFKNNANFLFVLPFVSICIYFFIVSKGNILEIAASAIGIIVGILIVRQFVGLYFKNSIHLSRVDYVKRQFWDKTIDKDRNFWGTGKYKYHFPTGINKKANPEVIFVHIKERKAAIGFVPDDMENVISTLKEKGIKIST